jgi:hypothetical protein
MPSGPTSLDSDSEKPSTPNFAAAYPARPGGPTRPPIDDIDRRPYGPIFVENRGRIFGCDCIHLSFSLIFSLRSESACRLGLTGENRYGQSRNGNHGGTTD